MKRILLLFLPFLPYLATAQVAKDTVTVLTIADIPAGAIRDTTNLTFVQDNAFNKARFDSLARYVTSKLIGDRGDITVSGSTGLTWELDAGVVDSMQLSAGAVVLPGAKVTGTLPVSKGGTGTETQFTAGSIVFAGAGGVYSQNNSGLFWDNANGNVGIGTNNPASRLVVKGIASSDASTSAFNVTNSSDNSMFFVRNDGNVGVGTNSPGIIGTGYTAVDVRGSLGGGLRFGKTNAENGVLYANGSIMSFESVSNIPVTIGTNNAERVRITSTGDVGIGTNSPVILGGGYTVVDVRGSLGGGLRFGKLNAENGILYADGSATGLQSTSNIPVTIGTNNAERVRITSTGDVGIGVASPSSTLHLKAGTASANTSPLKFTSGTNLTTPEAGAMEFNGTNLFFTPSTTRHTVNHGLAGSATLDFVSTNAQNSQDLTITVTGASDGDVVSLGVPNGSVNANTCFTAWVSATNTVTVRFNNYSSGAVDPASGVFKVFVTK